MNLRDLNYVVAVAELGHFGRAAEACRVSQPTLSGQILKLEEELGVRIFERDGRKVRLSSVGSEIVSRARSVVAAVEEIAVIAKSSQDPMEGPIRLGLIPTLAPYLLPHILPSLAQALPKARLTVAEDLTVNLVEGLSAGRLDAVVIATDPKREKLIERLLFEEAFWLATPIDHPLSARESVSANDIDPDSLLLLADGHCLRDQALEFCGQLTHSDGRADLSAASLETLLHLTAANQGVTLVPRLAILGPAGARADFKARPLEGPGHSRKIRLVYRASSPRVLAIEGICAAMRASLPSDVVALD